MMGTPGHVAANGFWHPGQMSECQKTPCVESYVIGGNRCADVLKRGYRFTHASFIAPEWKPEPGQKMKEGPKAEMVVTRVTSGTVWYGYELGWGAGWRMDRDTFIERYIEGRR